MRRSLSYILAITLLISCTKSERQSSNYRVTALVLDWDSRVPLQGAKVYLAEQFIQFGVPWKIFDSATTDINGKASFTRSEAEYSQVYAINKPGYIQTIPIGPPITLRSQDRTDTSYLVRPSFVNLTIHNNHSYMSGDSVVIRAKGHSNSQGQPIGVFETIFSGLAVSPDRVISVWGFYSASTSTMIGFEYEVYRNNSSIYYGGPVYAMMTQFGTVNYTINY